VIAVDTSVLVAMIKPEPEAARVRAALESANGALISTGNLLELQLIAAGRHGLVWSDAEQLLAVYNIAIHPFDERQLRFARDAAVKYGKGRHKAALNFGDCFAYALAKSEGLPLLCTGRDFRETDLEIA
jgi:ribonuclease VapC